MDYLHKNTHSLQHGKNCGKQTQSKNWAAKQACGIFFVTASFSLTKPTKRVSMCFNLHKNETSRNFNSILVFYCSSKRELFKLMIVNQKRWFSLGKKKIYLSSLALNCVFHFRAQTKTTSLFSRLTGEWEAFSLFLCCLRDVGGAFSWARCLLVTVNLNAAIFRLKLQSRFAPFWRLSLFCILLLLCCFFPLPLSRNRGALCFS